MKNTLKIALLSAGIFAASQTFAQSPEDHNIGHKIGKAAQDVGHKTSELAAKGAATVTDKRYDEKRGPHGEIVYIDKHAKYFYVDKLGHRRFLKKSQLKNEVEKH